MSRAPISARPQLGECPERLADCGCFVPELVPVQVELAARFRRRERPRPVREPDPRGREDVRFDAAAGGGRAGFGPLRGPRPKDLSGRRDVAGGGENRGARAVRRARRRRPRRVAPGTRPGCLREGAKSYA